MRPADLSTAVVVPTYRRPKELVQCVTSILQAERRPDELWIVGRRGDHATARAIESLQRLHSDYSAFNVRWVDVPGHIVPVREGLQAATSLLIAVVDDDVTVTPHWLERLARHFTDPSIGVVGGRVIVPKHPKIRLKGRPGDISWYGKHWGNIASVGGDAAFDTWGVQECNWMWRRTVALQIEWDMCLNFDEAPMYGLDLCIQVRRLGYRVVYDPQAIVYHHIAPRSPELDRRDRPRRIYAYCRNYTYIMMKHLPWWRKLAFLSWWFMIGERGGWAPASLVVGILQRHPRWRQEAWPALRGKLTGLRLWWQYGKTKRRNR